jgi:tetratricopeptide (TPR) repeat protein
MTRSVLAAGAALGLFVSCASSQESHTSEVSELVARGHYSEAVRLAAEQSQKRPKDPAAKENHRLASVAYLLEQGRRATFEDRDEEALAHFDAAHEIAPDLPEVQAWIEKTRDKLTFRWLSIGAERYASEDLPGTQEALEEALKHDPDNAQANFYLGRVLLLINHRTGLGESYYAEGVRALADYWLNQAKSRFGYTNKYLPDSVRASQREQEVDLLLAGQRAALARDLESQGRFAAARNEFRLTLTLDPDNAEALAGFERCGREVQAEEDLEVAGMMVVRGRFDDAQRLLEEAAALSTRQVDKIHRAEVDLLEARLAAIYERARNLESDGLYAEAIAAYSELLAQAEYYSDAIARKSTLEDFLRDAESLYERAAAEQDPERKISLLRQIQTFWPDFKDVRVQLIQLGGADPD